MRVSTFLSAMLVGLVVATTTTYTAAEDAKYKIAGNAIDGPCITSVNKYVSYKAKVEDGKLRAVYLVPLSTFQAYKGSVEQSKSASNGFKIQFDSGASCPPPSGTGDAARLDKCEIGSNTPVETKITTEPFCILLDNTATATEAKVDLTYSYGNSTASASIKNAATNTITASIKTTATLALSASLMAFLLLI
jgi:hypothetical protein